MHKKPWLERAVTAVVRAIDAFIFGPMDDEPRDHFRISETDLVKEPKPVSKTRAKAAKKPARKTAPAKKARKTKVVRRSRAKSKG